MELAGTFRALRYLKNVVKIEGDKEMVVMPDGQVLYEVKIIHFFIPKNRVFTGFYVVFLD